MKLARAIVRRIINFLTEPNVRYKYLPKLRDVISYDRKETMLHTCLEYVDLAVVKGDYVEFGTWRGRSMIVAYHLSRLFPSLSEMRFYGFDSFEGIPSLTINKTEAEEFPEGSFRAGLDEVRRNLTNANVDMERVTLVPGWYADTLTRKTSEGLPLKAASVVNVDCDVFESTVPVLDFIEPYLVDGSIIIFDDWYCFKNREELGQQKAFREWLERNRYLKVTPYKEFGWDGKAFIINRIAHERVPLQRHEYVLDLLNDSVITRTLEGKISFWNRSAEEFYGWSKEEAIGKICHNLLQTQFPISLEEIESELVKNGLWEGKLVHITRDGGRVVVDSRWALDLAGHSRAVIEINTRSTDNS